MNSCRLFYIVFICSQTILGLESKSKHLHKHHRHEGNVKKSQTDKSKPLVVLPKIPGNNPLGLAVEKLFGLGNATHQIDKGKIKTEKNVTTKVNGPFKTVTTVTNEYKIGKNNTKKLVGKSIQSVTTNVNISKEDERKPDSYLHWGLPFGSYLFRDEDEGQCSAKKPCKKKGTYCNKLVNLCEATRKPGSKCDQPGQCSTKKGHYACIWGQCTLVSKARGHIGQFCEDDKSCQSDNLQCVTQDDVSRISNICTPKPGEGQTCGRKQLIHFWPLSTFTKRAATSSCKKGLECVAIGAFGRMVCQPKGLLKDRQQERDFFF